MNLTLDAEQEAIRDAIRGVLRDRMTSAHVREVMATETALDPAMWQTAGELGWLGLAVPEAKGGSGYGVAEAMLLFVELGRTVAPGPWLGSVLAADALASAGGTQLGEVLAGRLRVAVIDAGTTAGEARDVVDAGAADAFLVLGADQVSWLGAGDVVVEAAPCMDPTRRLGRVRLGKAGTSLDVAPARLRLLATVLAAAEAAGVAERTLETSVEYGKVREQFGKPIGSFQAIKHRCADMAVRAEVARSVVTYAAVVLDEGGADAGHHVHVAKALATEAALQNATDNVQNHGGMGYTWESDAHLFLKRARLLEHCFGSRTDHLDALSAPWRAAS